MTRNSDVSSGTVKDMKSRERLLEEAMDAQGNYVLWYFTSLTKSAEDAEELASSLWVYVYEKFPLHAFQHIGFLRRKGYQLFVDAYRKKSLRSFLEVTDDPPEVAVLPRPPEPCSAEEERAMEARFWEQFPGLQITEIQKSAFWLTHRYGYHLNEVSQRLNTPKSTIHDWLKAVKQQCLNILNSQNL